MKKLTVVFFVLISITVRAQIITTWMNGNGFGGGVDGLGDGCHIDSAIFADPGAVYFDKEGNFYFADVQGNRIRKVDTSGIITSIAGTGTAGYSGDGGLANTAQLNEPTGVIVDSIGDIYIADPLNYRIRKINHANNIISTIAGTGVPGFSGDSGLALNAKLLSPTDLCFDHNGNLLFADGTRVRKIDRSGLITTIAGTDSFYSTVSGGHADTTSIGSVTGICIDTLGNIFISDGTNAKIYEINTVRIITIVAGTSTGYLYNGDNIPAITAQIIPNKLTIDIKTNNLFFNDYPPNNRIRMIDNMGIIHTVAGNGTGSYSGEDGLAIAAGIPDPNGLGFDNCDNLFISQVYIPVRISKVTFDTSCHIHTAQVSVENVKAPLGVKVYPNPTSDILNVEVTARVQYRLINIVSAVMQHGTLQVGNNSIPVTVLPSGMYVLDVIDKDGIVTRQKVCVSH